MKTSSGKPTRVCPANAQGRAEEARSKAAKRDAWAKLPVDEKLAQVRGPRLAKEVELGVDGALMDWAGGHSS